MAKLRCNSQTYGKKGPKYPEMPIFAIFHSFADIKGPINGLCVFLSMKTTSNPLPNDLRKSKSQKNSQSWK